MVVSVVQTTCAYGEVLYRAGHMTIAEDDYVSHKRLVAIGASVCDLWVKKHTLSEMCTV